jgi:hypothetical protein
VDATTGGYHTIKGNTTYSNTAEGIKVGLSNGGNNEDISYNTSYNNYAQGIYMGTNVASSIVEHNTVYQNCQGEADCYNIEGFELGNNNIYRFNLTYADNYISTDAGGIRFDGNTGTFGSGNQMYYNISLNEWNAFNTLNNPNGSAVYNNVAYNSTAYGIWIHGASNSGTLVKNNIVYKAGTYLVWNEDAVAGTYSNNLYYDTSLTNKFNWNETTYSTLAAYQTASSQEPNSVSSNPLFTNGSGSYSLATDFTLQAGSPATGRGTGLALSSDYFNNPVVPGFVTIGAAQYQPQPVAGVTE